MITPEQEILFSQLQELINSSVTEERYDFLTDNNITEYFKAYNYMNLSIGKTNIMFEIFLATDKEPYVNSAKKFASILIWCQPDILPTNFQILENLKDLDIKIQNFILSNLDIINNDEEYSIHEKRWMFYLNE